MATDEKAKALEEFSRALSRLLLAAGIPPEQSLEPGTRIEFGIVLTPTPEACPMRIECALVAADNRHRVELFRVDTGLARGAEV